MGVRNMSKIARTTESGTYLSYVNTSSAQPSDYSPVASSASALDVVWVLTTPQLATELAGETEWTDEKSRRRSALVDKEIVGNISPAEQAQLAQLQAEMLAYRRKVAPLPLEVLRELHQQLLHDAGDEIE